MHTKSIYRISIFHCVCESHVAFMSDYCVEKKEEINQEGEPGRTEDGPGREREKMERKELCKRANIQISKMKIYRFLLKRIQMRKNTKPIQTEIDRKKVREKEKKVEWKN